MKAAAAWAATAEKTKSSKPDQILGLYTLKSPRQATDTLSSTRYDRLFDAKVPLESVTPLGYKSRRLSDHETLEKTIQIRTGQKAASTQC